LLFYQWRTSGVGVLACAHAEGAVWPVIRRERPQGGQPPETTFNAKMFNKIRSGCNSEWPCAGNLAFGEARRILQEFHAPVSLYDSNLT
jgi:hypothetical protein